jgi:hypothetical protein
VIVKGCLIVVSSGQQFEVAQSLVLYLHLIFSSKESDRNRSDNVTKFRHDGTRFCEEVTGSRNSRIIFLKVSVMFVK